MNHHSLLGVKDLDCNLETQNVRGGEGGGESELAEEARIRRGLGRGHGLAEEGWTDTRETEIKVWRQNDKAKTKYRGRQERLSRKVLQSRAYYSLFRQLVRKF